VAQATPRYLRGIGNATPTSTVVIRPRIDGQLLSVDFKEGDIVHAGKLLATMDTATRWQHELAYQEERLSQFRAGHVDAGMIQSVQADVDRAQLELSHAEIRSPIDGITGFLQIGAGNIVHSGEPLVVVTQIQPIAVVFTIPEDTLPRVRAQTARGTSPLAEAWDRANSTRIASGRLIAIDNQIDPQTGTAKLKAVFENKEGALFPNQFVNVRLYLN
jgi:multidrug efflux system membrane fusion protein